MPSQVFTGTATDYLDLLTKVKTHLTSGTMGSQAWTVEADDTTTVPGERFLYLTGPGLSGTDEIHVNIRAYQSVGSDYYNWQIRGSVAYGSTYFWHLQPGTSPAANLLLWQSAIPYWLIANGRRFILVAKVSTTYQTLYAGFIMPYATSAEMPYPLFIGASAAAGDLRWSNGTYRLGAPWDAPQSACYLRHFDGAWANICNFRDRGDTTREELADNNCWPWQSDYRISQNADGGYTLFPSVLHGTFGGANTFGELEGVYYVSGFSNASEDIIDVGSDDYLVVQSAYRTDRMSYAAIKLG